MEPGTSLRAFKRNSNPEPEPEPWAYIDTDAYWNPGVTKIGEFGQTEFLSDDMVRGLTRKYREGYTVNSRYLDWMYYVIKVHFLKDDVTAFALYDDNAHTIYFNDTNLEQFLAKLDMIMVLDKDDKDIVNMARKRMKE